jgi:DNA-binding NtrC family response regulator
MEGSILILDTDTGLGAELACFLKEHTITLFCYANSEGFLTHLRERTYDVILIDMNGIEDNDVRYEELKHITDTAAFVLVSNEYRRDLEVLGRNLTTAFYFVKPYDVNDIFAVIVRSLEMRDRNKMKAVQRMKYREGVFHG